MSFTESRCSIGVNIYLCLISLETLKTFLKSFRIVGKQLMRTRIGSVMNFTPVKPDLIQPKNGGLLSLDNH